MALSKTTQDHDEIRQWAEKRGAIPAEVKGTENKNQTGILRFCFPDAVNRNDANLREIAWDEFFEKFDQNGLELIYQDVTSEGAQSNFNKLVYPEDEHAGGHRKASGSSASTTTARASGTHAKASSSSGTHAKSSASHSSGGKSSASSSRAHTSASHSSGSGTSSRSSGSRSTAAHSGKTSGSKSSASKSSGSRSSGSKGTRKAA